MTGNLDEWGLCQILEESRGKGPKYILSKEVSGIATCTCVEEGRKPVGYSPQLPPFG